MCVYIYKSCIYIVWICMYIYICIFMWKAFSKGFYIILTKKGHGALKATKRIHAMAK